MSATPLYKSPPFLKNPKPKSQFTHPNEANPKMEKCNSFLTFPILINVLCFLLLPQPILSIELNEFSRQPPRPVILTTHNRSESDPQQVP